MTEPLSPERLAEIRDIDPGDWYAAPWTTEHVESDGDEPAYYRVKSEGHVIATLPDFAGPLAEFIADAREAVPQLVAEVERQSKQVASVRAFAVSHDYRWLLELLDGYGTHGGHL